MESWLWPQWAVVAGYALSLILHAGFNGKDMDIKWNFALKLCSVTIAAFILYMGGFWS